jgi:endonuclease/exonuclease/phosphatase (EEP) superfamily protein YafD
MIKFYLERRRVRLGLSMLLLLPALLVIFAPAVYSFKWLVDYSVQVMFAYLGAGFLFLILSKNYWLGLTWGSCIVLCLFLKYTSNQAFSFETPTGGKIVKIANYNVSFVEDSVVTNLTRSILENNAQLISIQEMTPDLDSLVVDGVKEKYPYVYSLKRADYYGMLVLSSSPFIEIDTFNFGTIPNIRGSLAMDGGEKKVDFIISYCQPSFSSSTYQQLKEHLKMIATKAKQSPNPIITMGTYNTVPWAPEVQDFKKIARLNDSRLGLAPTTASSSNPLFQIPIDHIFHSSSLKCTNFQAITYRTFTHLGIEGTYEVLAQY